MRTKPTNTWWSIQKTLIIIKMKTYFPFIEFSYQVSSFLDRSNSEQFLTWSLVLLSSRYLHLHSDRLQCRLEGGGCLCEMMGQIGQVNCQGGGGSMLRSGQHPVREKTFIEGLSVGCCQVKGWAPDWQQTVNRIIYRSSLTTRRGQQTFSCHQLFLRL